MHILDTIWKETLFVFVEMCLWKCEIIVGEYNTLDLVKYVFFYSIVFEMQEKGHNVLFQFRLNLDYGR